MELYFTDSESYRIIGYTIAAYCVVFAIRNIIKTARRGDFIVNRQFSIGNMLKAIIQGLSIPAVVTIVGVVVATFLWVAQDPPRSHINEWEPSSWLHVFTGLVLFCQALVFMYAVCAALYFSGRAAYRHLLKPSGNSISRAYRTIRPRVPVRW